VAFVQEVLANEIYAVGIVDELLPDVGDVEILNVFPPVVYPVPELDTSLEVVYTVVSALMSAAAVYSAILNVLGDVGPKL
jgi:hypothetical protein